MDDNKKRKLRKCPPSKPNPPCKEDEIEKEKIYKNGDFSICCYKNKQKKSKTKKSKKKSKKKK